MSEVRVGTSGWSYPEWVGPFYPEKTSAARMLPYYGARFTTVEAHSTHRRLPTPAALTRWLAQVPPTFRFAVKAHAGITHRRDLDGVTERVIRFYAALEPLRERLGPVLFVLPHRQPDLPRLDGLLTALAAAAPPAASAPVFELAPDWWVPEVLDRLAAHPASLAVIDKEGGPEPPAQALDTGPVGYVRLRRGTYTEDDLRRWAERLRAAAAGTPAGVYAFVKHDDQGDGPRYAQSLVEHLERG